MERLTEGQLVQRNINNQMDKMVHSVENTLTISCLCNELMIKENIDKGNSWTDSHDFPQSRWSGYYNSWEPKQPNSRGQYCVSFLVLHTSQLHGSRLIFVDSSRYCGAVIYQHWNGLYSGSADGNPSCL